MQKELASESFGGQTLMSREIGGLLFVENSYLSGMKLSTHRHHNAYFCLVRQGGFSETSGGKSQRHRSSTLIFHPPNESHSDHFGKEGGRCFNIQLSSDWLNRFRARHAAFETPAHYREGILVQLATRLYHECKDIDDDISSIVIEGLALEIIGEAARAFTRSAEQAPRRLKQAQDFLHANFANSLSLATIAKEVGVHPTHLARLFRRNFRCTVGEYIRNLRVEFARREIATSDTPLALIASSAGFSDQSHFSKTFKRLTGYSPTQFRTILRLR
jgi:AraC family transcriptional regulator